MDRSTPTLTPHRILPSPRLERRPGFHAHLRPHRKPGSPRHNASDRPGRRRRRPRRAEPPAETEAAATPAGVGRDAVAGASPSVESVGREAQLHWAGALRLHHQILAGAPGHRCTGRHRRYRSCCLTARWRSNRKSEVTPRPAARRRPLRSLRRAPRPGSRRSASPPGPLLQS